MHYPLMCAHFKIAYAQNFHYFFLSFLGVVMKYYSYIYYGILCIHCVSVVIVSINERIYFLFLLHSSCMNLPNTHTHTRYHTYDQCIGFGKFCRIWQIQIILTIFKSKSNHFVKNLKISNQIKSKKGQIQIDPKLIWFWSNPNHSNQILFKIMIKFAYIIKNK